jgi:hypothetical protein
MSEHLDCTAMSTLGLPPIRVDFDELATTTESYPFDRAGWEFIARAGRLTRLLVDATGPLTVDEAVIGGLLVRVSKLLFDLFRATQEEESEAHGILARCVLEATVDLRWLSSRNDPTAFRRYRADSFASRRRWLDEAAADERGDAAMDATLAKVTAHTEAELVAAGVEWDDVPRRPHSWGGSLRQRMIDLDLERDYTSFFAGHSNYVHGSWHEIRAFHVQATPDGYRLDPTFGELSAPSSFATAREAFAACESYVEFMPDRAIDVADVGAIAAQSAAGCVELASAFAEFVERGGIDYVDGRHTATSALREVPASDEG